jgi:hypothetical protein
LNSGDNSVQSSPTENRAKQTNSSQRVSATISRTDSHDSTTKIGRSKTDSENSSILQQVNDELHSTVAARVVSNMAKMATNKMAELLSK